MNSRTPAKGTLGCLLFLIAVVSGTMPIAFAAAAPTAAPPRPSDTSNPYAVIVERNIFHLTAPPPPPEPEKPKLELPVIKITGFVNIGNSSRVLFVSEPKDKKEDPTYYSLAQGERSSDGKHQLELVRILPSQEGADVINDGVAVTLTVKDDSLGATPMPTAASAPNQGERPIRPRGGRPMFPGRPIPGIPGVPGGNGFSFPARGMRRNIPQ